jgi:phage repressor protein C with HTH and peptisase S24 domain
MRDDDPPLLRDLMRFKPEGWTANAWAVEARVSRSVWTDIRHHANPSRRTLERLLTAAGSSLAEFEALRIAPPPPTRAETRASVVADASRNWRSPSLVPIPIYPAQAEPGVRPLTMLRFDPQRSLGSVQRPASLIGETAAFALPVVDDAMRPRFRPGRQIIVVPGRAVTAGDDVLAVVGEGLAAIAVLVERRDDGLLLRQHRSDAIVALPLCEVHLIVGEAL